MKLLILSLIIALPHFLFSQGGANCSTMEPICTDIGLNFTANSGVPEASTTDPGNDYDCLNTQPNPTWYYFEIATNGNIDMNLTAPSDIDYIIWGPFSSISVAQAACGDLGNPPSNNVVDCSYSSTNNEFPSIPFATAGQVYVMLITNYADLVQNVTLSQVGGTGSTDCTIITNPACAMSAFNVNVSGCEFTTNTYDVTGTIEFTDPPTSGSLIVEDCNGNTTVVDTYPFAASPLSFSLNNLAANGLACDVTAYFTADVACTQNYAYVAPLCLANCPTYDLQASSPTEACGGQIYSLEVQNLGCDGYIEFDVVGNYGSSYASEITWQVTSNLTSNIVASGGPGTNGANFNVTTAQLDPAVQGYIYTLTLTDSYGDGFNGTGGTITIQVDGNNLIVPITGNFGTGQTIMFQAPLVVSTSTMTVNTPSGIVSSVMGNCQDHEVQFTLSNTNYCSAIEVDLPWVITCDNSGATIASGTHTVVVYPQVPDQASDLVSITWNTTTCTWDVSTNNDCDALDIGTIFDITPDPSTLPTYCTNGNEVFTVDYIGLAGSPNCCSTAGPAVPISYSVTETKPNAIVTNSPFGGVNNSAFVDLAANGTGGNATAVSLTVSYTGYCENIASTTGDNMWVTVYVDGFIIYDAQQTTANFTQTFTLANMPFGYNENSVVEVYYYPNQLGSTVFSPGTACGSLPLNYWNFNALSVSLNATFEQQTPTPVSCDLPLNSAYTCCVVTPMSATPPAPVSVQCSADVPAANIASVTSIISDCATTVTHLGDASNGLSCPEIVTRTYRVTDDCGNFIDVTQLITIDDTQAPVFAAVAPSISVQCAADATMTGLTWTDNCDGSGSVMGVDVSDGNTCPETITRTWTYTDNCGNTTSSVQTIIVDDTTPPVASNPAPSSATMGSVPGPDVSIVVGETDNCTAIPLVEYITESSDGGLCPEIITRTYKVSDNCGNFVLVYHAISVGDPIAPTASNLAPASYECVANIPLPDVSLVTDEADNGAPPVVTFDSDVSDGNSCPEIITRKYKVTDDCGNFIFVTQIFTVEDITSPVLAAAPGNVTVSCPTDIPAMTSLIWTDNCDGTNSVLGTDVSDGLTCPETITRTWTYTDNCGNIATRNQTILVHDLINPVLAAPPVGVTVSCSADVPVMTSLNWTDNCDGTNTVLGSDVSDGASCPETITRTWTYTDNCGNTASQSQTIIVNDLIAPVFNAPPVNVTVSCIADVPAMTLLTWTDNCDGTNSILGTDVSDGASCPETITRTWVYTDNCGNTSSESQVIIVHDLIAPNFAVPPASITVKCTNEVPVMTSLSWSDNCDGVGSVLGTDASDGLSCPETITRTWTYTDNCGNTSSETQTIIVHDLIAPVLDPAPVNVTVSCSADIPAMTSLTWTDNCDGTNFVLGTDVTDGLSCPETITRTWTYTDNCGNTTTETQTIIVHDLIAPVFAAAPIDVTVSCSADVPVMTSLTWTDNCDGTNSVLGTDASDGLSCPETITRTWTYTDNCGNIRTETQTITVHDLVSPVFAAAPVDVTVSCSADVPAMTSLAWTDNCDGTNSVLGTDVSDGLSCPETITRTWTYTDNCGNIGTETQTITVHDLVAPVFAAAPIDITVSCSADIPVMTSLTWTDNCDGTNSVLGTDASDGLSCPETITRTWTYTDNCGNIGTETQTIIVHDLVDPILAAAPANTTIECIGDLPIMDNLVWLDNCDGSGVIAGTDGPLVGGTCGGTITRTWTYTDACGNTATTNQIFTVDDNTAPVLAAAPVDVTVECIGDLPVMTDLGWTDNCDGSGIIAGTDGALVGGACGGTITRTWTYTDACGNTASTTQTITIDDNTLPTASNPTTTIVPGGPAPAVDITVVTDEADNCSVPVVAFVSESTDGGFCPETITRIYSVTDACGNTINVTHTILITDPIMPTASNPLPINVECIADVPLQDEAVVTDEVDNNGAPVVAWVSDVSDNGACPEIITRTYSVTDACGNSINVTQTITVLDVTDPILASAPANTTIECIGDLPVMPDLSWTDNCDGTGVVAGTDGPLVGGSCGGTITRTWTYTDACGNTATTNQIITVDDNTAPVLAAAPVDVTVECIGDLPVMTDLAWTDNCDGSGIVTGTDGALVGGACGGTITRTWTYTDACGNTASTTQTITIDDNTLPTASNPTTTTVPGGPAPAVDVTAVTDEADNCSVPVVAFVSESTDGGFCPETITRIYSVTDACGNTINVTHTILITDPIMPTASNPLPINVECIADVPLQDEAVVTDEADNNGAPVVAWVSDVSDNGTCPEIITRTYSVTDACGNSINVTQTITVLDVTDPILAAAPANTTIECIGDLPVMSDLAWTDNCDGTGVIAGTDGPLVGGSCGGTITRTWTYTDACGNAATTNQIITVDDNTSPVLAAAPVDVTVECIGDLPVMADLAWTDNCDGSGTVAGIEGGIVGSECGGTITRTWTYTDACGNSATATQTITINDNTSPTASNPTTTTVPGGPAPAVDVSVVTDEADNCSVPVVAFVSEVTDGGFCPETITRIYSVTDDCGNSINVTHTILITDPIVPTASNPLPINVECIGDVPLPDVTVVTDEADNNGAPTIAFVIDVSDNGSCPEIITRLYSVTDACGNTINVAQTITVKDVTNPTASNPAPISVECIGDVPLPNVAVVADEADNCTVIPIVNFVSDVSDGNTCPETITRTYSITDDCNNMKLVSQTITVLDNTAPTASNPTTLTLDASQSLPLPDITVVTDAMDNCTMNPIITFVADVSNGEKCPETITRSYSIIDDCGNSTIVNQTIIMNSGCEIVIPSAFTPNDDLSNDVWEIVDIDLIYPSNKVFVYNRWGNLLYESTEGKYASNPWEGKMNGEKLPVASYFYIIYTEGDNSGEVMKGTVSIIKN